MTKIDTHRFVLCMALSACLLQSARAHAYTHQNVCNSGGEPEWSNGSHPVYELRCSANGYTTANSSTDSGAYSNVNGAMANAYWMWVKDGTSDASIYINNTQCLSGPENGAWFEGMSYGTGGTSELWYEPGSSMPCSGALGCTSLRYKCLLTDRIYSSDIAMNQSPGGGSWDIIRQDTLAECLSTQATVWGLTALHEVGHSYDLGHEQGEMNMMRSTSGGVRPRNCHVAQGYQPTPFPDDMNGLMSFYRNFSPSTPPRNYTGTPFYLNGSAGALAVQQVFVSTNTQPVYVPWSVESMYRHTSTSVTIYYRAVLVPIGAAPTYNWSTSTWSFPSGTKFRSQRFLTTSDPSLDDLGFTAFNAFTESIVGTTLTRGTNYRLWIQVDPYGYASEVDEGDNVFPTNIRVLRF